MTSRIFLRILPIMAITPLYSAEEIDAEIAQAKLDLAAARKSLSTQISTGGTDRRVQREQVKALQDHLSWLQNQRVSLQLPAGAASGGAQAHVGRPQR